ncbi:MAG: hypothetical protein ACRKGH_05265 [Dehalogenimonas sp.]
MNDDKEKSTQEQMETEDQTEKSTKQEEKDTFVEIRPESDNPDELDPRLFSPLQESEAAPAEERIPETAQTEEEKSVEECETDNK